MRSGPIRRWAARAVPGLVLILALQVTWAQSYWVRYGWEVFRSGGDARSLALGRAQVAAGGSAAAALFNPAHHYFPGPRPVTYAHQSRLNGMINSDLVAFPLTKPNLGVVILYEGISRIPDTREILLDFGSDGIPGTGDAGEGNGLLDEGERLDEEKLTYFNQRQVGLHLSSAWSLKPLVVGLGLKILRQAIGEYSGTGMGLDLGMLWNPRKSTTLGVMVADVTTSLMVWESGTLERTPPSLNLGLAQEANLGSWSLTALAAVRVDPAGESLGDDFRIARRWGGNYQLGLEVSYAQRLALRLGRLTVGSPSAGLGLAWSHLALNYAFQSSPPTTGLGPSHYLSLSFDPAWIRDQAGRILD